MEKAVAGLSSALGLSPREHLAIVGGGGKTSLLNALAEELKGRGERVLTSTTTKIWQKEALRAPCVILTRSDVHWADKLVEGVKKHGHVFLGRCFHESGKVEGIDPELADELFREQKADYLVVEADGSSGRPVKVHDLHEPVVPGSATGVIAVMGLEALGRRASQEIVFRWDLFLKLSQMDPGEPLTAQVLAGLFSESGGLFKGTPAAARRIAFLNKTDLVSDEEEARNLAHLILGDDSNGINRVIMGSIKEGKYRVIRRNHT